MFEPDVFTLVRVCLICQSFCQLPFSEFSQQRFTSEIHPRVAMSTKIMVLGPSEAGKTTLISLYTDPTREFSANAYTETVGIGTFMYTFRDKPICFWDIAGRKIFQVLSPLYFRDTSAFILVFDVATHTLDPEPVQDELRSYVQTIDTRNATSPIFLVGNKLDLVDRSEFTGRFKNLHSSNRISKVWFASATWRDSYQSVFDQILNLAVRGRFH